MSKKVLIIGGSGPAAVIGQAIVHSNYLGVDEYVFSGFINDRYRGDSIEGYPVLGGTDEIKKFVNDYFFIYTLYKIGEQHHRIQFFKSLKIPNERLATFVHPFAYVAPNSQLSPGTVVMPNASVSGNTKIGLCTIINNNVTIGHDNNVGNHCLFTANSCLGAWIKVEEGVWVGLNSTIRGKTVIGKYSAVGLGAVVTKDIPEGELWIGSPARFHKKVNDKINL